jgi:argininosuccinate lyase
MLKGLPSGYNKDMQEDKPLLFDAVDTLLLLLPPTRETIAGLLRIGEKLNSDTIRRTCSRLREKQ